MICKCTKHHLQAKQHGRALTSLYGSAVTNEVRHSQVWVTLKHYRRETQESWEYAGVGNLLGNLCLSWHHFRHDCSCICKVRPTWRRCAMRSVANCIRLFGINILHYLILEEFKENISGMTFNPSCSKCYYRFFHFLKHRPFMYIICGSTCVYWYFGQPERDWTICSVANERLSFLFCSCSVITDGV